jgi:hypothetical protein
MSEKRDLTPGKGGTGKAEAAKVPDAGISVKQCPEKLAAEKCWPAEPERSVRCRQKLCEQAKRNRKNQPCHDRHSSHNGARFKWLLRFAGGCVPLADHQELMGWVNAWRQCLRTLVPLLTICVKARRNSSPLAETHYSNSYSLTSIEPALRKIRPCNLTLRLNSFEL